MVQDRRWLYGGLFAAGGIGLVIALRSGTPKIKSSTRLLVIGDSLAKGLDPHLAALGREEGVASYLGNGIVGSRIDQWAKSPWLDDALAKFRPTLILVSLGTNDEYMGPNAAAKQAPALAQLLGKLKASGAELVWIGVPTLPVSNGVATMIEKQVPYYFPSTQIPIPRGPDRIHPTAAGYAGWAGALWRWLT
jgi:lysophospholipase L1-like esterase